MADVIASGSDARGWYRRPLIGLIAGAAVLCGLAVGHSMLVLIRHLLDAQEALRLSEVAVSLALGAIGLAMVWQGRLKGEATGTWMGFIAGALIWVGLFELGWKTFAHALNPAPVTYQGIAVLNPELQVIQASVVPFLMLMVFLTINKETRCNMMLWIRSKLRLRPGAPLTGKERNFAAITALESIATTWACYIVTIMIVDPRIVGNPMSMAAQAPYLALFVWGWYLIYRLTLQRQMAPALRYAIGAVTVNWIWIEAGSRADLYEEIWIKPVEYPLAMSTVLAVLIALLAIMYQQRGPRRSVDAFASA